jgi:uncharacterized protein (TIGR03435 family)
MALEWRRIYRFRKTAVRHLGIALPALLLGSMAVQAQNAGPSPDMRFEVASVKEHRDEIQGGSISGPTPGRFTISSVPLRFILLYAFELRAHQLVNAPDWTDNAIYDIAGTYPPRRPKPSEAEVRAMLRALLADRFQLATRKETRELPVYALVLARKDGRLGPQLVRSEVDCEKWLAEKKPQQRAGRPSPVSPDGFRPACMMITSRQFLTGGARTIAELTASLQSLLGRPVVDRTGLNGAFDVDLRWAPTPDTPPRALGSTPSLDDAAAIVTAVQEQLGLKLESTRAPVNVVVVDRVERPVPD